MNLLFVFVVLQAAGRAGRTGWSAEQTESGPGRKVRVFLPHIIYLFIYFFPKNRLIIRKLVFLQRFFNGSIQGCGPTFIFLRIRFLLSFFLNADSDPATFSMRIRI